jgi:hypothetical protein
MAHAPVSGQEYWRPANPRMAQLFEPISGVAFCQRCGMQFSPEACFCHICGSSREVGLRLPAASAKMKHDTGRTAAHLLWSRTPLPLASLVCFVLGIVCILGAALMGVIYRTDTLIDWQAVQIWRVEWLLAALVALLAGLLLKKAEC